MASHGRRACATVTSGAVLRRYFAISGVFTLSASLIWGVNTLFLLQEGLGLGFSFYSGVLEAWLVDALDASGFDGNLDAVFSRGAIVSGAAMLVGTLAGGLLGQLVGLPSWRAAPS